MVGWLEERKTCGGAFKELLYPSFTSVFLVAVDVSATPVLRVAAVRSRGD